MAEYMVWHPRKMPEHTDSIEYALDIAIEWIREDKGKVRNNVTITREDLVRPYVVAIIRGRRIE